MSGVASQQGVKRLAPVLLLIVGMLSIPQVGAVAVDAEDVGFVVPDETFLHEQWGLFNFGQEVGGAVTGTVDADIRAPEAWSISTGDPSVIVAVLDSGVSPHPDLVDAMWQNPGELPDNGVDDDGNGFVDDVSGWDFVDDDADPTDARVGELRGEEEPMAHGTAVASLIAAAHDGNGMAGVAPDVTILPVRVIGGGLFDRDIAAAIEYAVAAGARIVNMSMGTFVPGFGLPETMAVIASTPDVLFVAAAGNSQTDADSVRPEPCSSEVTNLLCVAATDQDDERAVFEPQGGSNVGQQTVDLAAPGDNLLVARPAYETLFEETFDDPAGWELDGWEIDGELVVSGGEEDSLAGMAAPLDLTDRHDCWLAIRARTDLPPGGGIFLQTSADGERWSLLGGFAMVGTTGGEAQTTHVPLALLEGGQGRLGFLARTGAAPSLSPGAATVEEMTVTCQSDVYSGREYVYAQGTSFSAPLVAGAAALVWSAHPSLTPDEVAEAIRRGVRPVEAMSDVTVTGGGLDALGALMAAAEMTPADGGGGDAGGPGAEAAADGALVGGLVLPEGRLPVPSSRGGVPGSPPSDPSPEEPAEPEAAPAAPGAAAGSSILPILLALAAAGMVGAGAVAYRVRRPRGRGIATTGLELPGMPISLAGPLTARGKAAAAALGEVAALPGIAAADAAAIEQDANDLHGGLGDVVRVHGQQAATEHWDPIGAWVKQVRRAWAPESAVRDADELFDMLQSDSDTGGPGSAVRTLPDPPPVIDSNGATLPGHTPHHGSAGVATSREG